MAQAQARKAGLRLVHDADAGPPPRGAFSDDVFFDKSQIAPGVGLVNRGVREAGSEWVVASITTHELGKRVGTVAEGIPARRVRFLSDKVTLRKRGSRATRTLPFGSLRYSAVWRLSR